MKKKTHTRASGVQGSDGTHAGKGTLPPDRLVAEAVALHRSGNLDGAQALYNRILEEQPDNAQVLNAAGVLRCQRGDHENGIPLLRRSIGSTPGNPSFLCNLAIALDETRRPAEALTACEQAILLKGDLADAHYYRGICLTKLGRRDEAVESYRRALSLDPSLSPAHNNLAILLMERGDLAGAIAAYGKAIEHNPGYAEAYNNLGNAYKLSGNCTLAIAAFEKSIALNPRCSEAYSNLAGAFKDQGDVVKALLYGRKALEADPRNPVCHSNFLLTLHYQEGIDPRDIFEQHWHWDALHGARLTREASPHPNDPSPGRRLRIGYVSPDFKKHSVAYFIEAVLAAHDHGAFEVFCYADVDNPDAVTAKLMSLADGWRDISALTDLEAASLIRSDRIDILVDLAGHTGKKQMTLFARKPAPIEITWLGYPDTTGLSAMDYRLTDAFADPIGLTEEINTEELLRLAPSFLCYTPPAGTPEVGPLPLKETGSVTFGSFNNRAKITESTVRLWSGILQALPDARLVVKANTLSDREVRENLLGRFEKNGVLSDRITLHGYIPSLAEHFSLYNRIDIALDTFPYHGTTTTCEALWMGVPVIVLEGDAHVSRVGASILSNVGLSELIVCSPEEYACKAAALARDEGRLEAMRRGLRERMRRSPLMDRTSFTRGLEEEYRRVWSLWCGKALGRGAAPEGGSGHDGEARIEALIRKGEELFQEGRAEDAKQCFQEALEARPDSIAALNNLGVVYHGDMLPASSAECFQKVLGIDPGNEDARANLATLVRGLDPRMEEIEFVTPSELLGPSFKDRLRACGARCLVVAGGLDGAGMSVKEQAARVLSELGFEQCIDDIDAYAMKKG